MVTKGLADLLQFDKNEKQDNATALYLPKTINVTFETGSAVLDKPGEISLTKSVVRNLLALPYLTITLIGHTDNVPTPQGNMQLSLDRAISSKNYVLSVTNKITGDRIKTEGKGDTKPIVPNNPPNTPNGTPENRRIEMQQD